MTKRISRLFEAAGAGDTVRVAMFRWDIPWTVDALLAAQMRGARVWIVADHDVVTNPAGRRLVRLVEQRDPAPRNVVICKGACLPWRGAAPAPPSQDVMHLKLLLTDIAGVQSVATTSLNLEGRQSSQYNSLIRVVDPRYYEFGVGYFQRLRRQSWTAAGTRWDDEDKRLHGAVTASVYPHKRDLLLDTLGQVQCVRGARSVDVMIAVIQRYDIRAQLGRLHRAGCQLRVITTRDKIENWLQRPFSTSIGRFDLPDDWVRTISTHDKVVAIHARWGGRNRYLVVTGTSNSTCGGLLYNDELMLRLEGRWVYDQYRGHVLDAYSRAHQSRESILPTQDRCRG